MNAYVKSFWRMTAGWAVLAWVAAVVIVLTAGCGQAKKGIEAANQVMEIKGPVENAARALPLVSGAQIPSRADQLYEIYQATPAWKDGFPEEYLRSTADAVGEVFASASPQDWKAYLNWVRRDPAPTVSQDGALLIAAIMSKKPADFEQAKLTEQQRRLYDVLYPAVGDFREILEGRVDGWSNEQLASFMAVQGAVVGMTPEKAAHDLWMLQSPTGKRLTMMVKEALIASLVPPSPL